MPVSDTAIASVTASVPISLASTVRVMEPTDVNLTAFPTRFVSICRMVAPIVREERNAGEMGGDLGIGSAEAVRQFLPQLGTVGVPHDDRRHRARPAKVIAVERAQQPLDVLPRKSPNVIRIVDVARGWTDQDQGLEATGIPVRCQDSNHGTHRMPDEDGLGELQVAAYLENVGGVAVERRVFLSIVGRWVGLSGADMIEQHHAMRVLECRSDQRSCRGDPI